MRYWQATVERGGVTRVLGVEGDTAAEALRVLAGRATLDSARYTIAEIIPPDERKPGQPRVAS
jgi:hypothetical protein